MVISKDFQTIQLPQSRLGFNLVEELRGSVENYLGRRETRKEENQQAFTCETVKFNQTNPG